MQRLDKPGTTAIEQLGWGVLYRIEDVAIKRIPDDVDSILHTYAWDRVDTRVDINVVTAVRLRMEDVADAKTG